MGPSPPVGDKPSWGGDFHKFAIEGSIPVEEVLKIGDSLLLMSRASWQFYDRWGAKFDKLPWLGLAIFFIINLNVRSTCLLFIQPTDLYRPSFCPCSCQEQNEAQNLALANSPGEQGQVRKGAERDSTQQREGAMWVCPL